MHFLPKEPVPPVTRTALSRQLIVLMRSTLWLWNSAVHALEGVLGRGGTISIREPGRLHRGLFSLAQAFTPVGRNATSDNTFFEPL